MAEPAPPEERVRRRGPWLQAFSRFRRRPLGVAALLILIAFALVAALADTIAPYPAARLFIEYLNDPQAPSLHHGHLLGTDVLGHDFLTQLVYAVRESMTGALICACGATLIGVAVGAAAGYCGGIVDAIVGWLTGGVVTMPALAVLVLVVVYNAPLAPVWFGVTLMLYLWTSIARVVRASFVSLRTRESWRRSTPPAIRAARDHAAPAAELVRPGRRRRGATMGQSIVIIATVDFFNTAASRPTAGRSAVSSPKRRGGSASPRRRGGCTRSRRSCSGCCSCA